MAVICNLLQFKSHLISQQNAPVTVVCADTCVNVDVCISVYGCFLCSYAVVCEVFMGGSVQTVATHFLEKRTIKNLSKTVR